MEKELIESIVRDVLGNLESDDNITKQSTNKSEGLTDKDYPLAKKQSDLVKTPSGKN